MPNCVVRYQSHCDRLKVISQDIGRSRNFGNEGVPSHLSESDGREWVKEKCLCTDGRFSVKYFPYKMFSRFLTKGWPQP